MTKDNPVAAGVAYTSLRSANVARQAAWCPEQTPDLSFRGNELAGEVGEVCNVVKKLERERLGWRGSRDIVEHLAEELADVVICADLVAISANIDLDAAVAAKFNATSEKVGLPHRLVAASPVQAGIDPLVAEIEAGLEGLPASAWRTETAWPADYAGYVVCGFFGATPHMPRLPQAQAFVVTDDDFDDDLNVAMARHVARCSPDNIAKLIAGYRSQAERIAALEVERDPAREYGKEARILGTKAEDKRIHEQHRASVAESLLAEAREALEEIATETDVRKAQVMALDALSRLKPGEKGGEK